MRKFLLLGSFLIAVVVGACSSKADVGSSCANDGKTDECVDGAICSKTATGALTCQKICTDQNQCPTNTTCNGTTGGSTKSCRPN